MPISKHVILTFVFTFLSLSFSFAKTKAKEINHYSKTITALAKLKSEAPLVLQINKVQKSELLGSITTQEGTLSYSNGQFKWEVSQPEKAMVIYDGETLWSVQSPPEGFDGPRQVLKAKPKGNVKDQMVINQLLSVTQFKAVYKHVKSSTLDGKQTEVVAPITKNQNISQLEIVLDEKTQALKEISYLDDLNNKTTFEVKEIKKKQKLEKNIFKFTPDAKDQVSNL